MPSDENNKSTERTSTSAQLLGSQQTTLIKPPNPTAMFRTISALIEILRASDHHKVATSTTKPTTATTMHEKYGKQPTSNTKTSDPTNTTSTIFDTDNFKKSANPHYQRTTNVLWQQTACVDHCNEYKFIDEFAICNDDNDDACLIIDNTNIDHNNTNESIEHFNNNQEHNPIDNSDLNFSGTNNINKGSYQSEYYSERRRKTPNTLNLISSNTKLLNTVDRDINQMSLKKRKLANARTNAIGKFSEQIQLNGIIEECEYDSDIGKFNCKTTNEQISSDNSSGSIEFLTDNASTGSLEDKQIFMHSIIEQNYSDNCECPPSKMVMERIEFFENSNGREDCENVNHFKIIKMSEEKENEHNNDNNDDKMYSTIFCLVAFILSAFGLYLFPLPG